VLLVVSAGKDGALTGGKAFMEAVGDDLIDSIVGENIPILTGEEKYNETVTSSVKRVVAKLSGKADPGAPFRCAGRCAARKWARWGVGPGRLAGGGCNGVDGLAAVWESGWGGAHCDACRPPTCQPASLRAHPPTH
jgi:hypothetical protein